MKTTKRGKLSQSIRNHRALVLLLLAFVFCTLPLFVHSLTRGQQEPRSFYYTDWASVAVWVSSADCARTTGAVLAVCQGDRLVPIADVTAGDDPGHALTLELYSMLTRQPVTAKDVPTINASVNFVGISLLASLLFCLRLPVVSLVVLTGGPLLASQYYTVGPHPANLGVACLAAILPLTVLGMPMADRSRKLFWVWFGLGICGLSAAMLYREAVGLMGVVASIVATCVSYFSSAGRTRGSVLSYVVVVCAAVAAMMVPKAIIHARDAAFNIPPSNMMQQHGAWHNLYIGLGAVENPFGISWDDAVAFEAARRIDPSVKFLSNDYYALLKHEYFEIVMHHPWEVAVVYLKKLWAALRISRIGLTFIAALVPIVYLRSRLRRSVAGWIAADAVVVVNLLFVGMFLAQAMLFHQSIQYLFPIEMFLLLGFGVAVHLALLLFRAGAGAREPATEGGSLQS
jgi:hypothetical protein